MYKKIIFSFFAGLLLQSSGFCEIKQNPDENTLWIETFSVTTDSWKTEMTLKSIDDCLSVTPGDAGKRCMGRYIKWDRAYPYLQLDFSKVGQRVDGYSGWFLVNSSAEGACVSSTGGGFLPGLWTFNINDFFPELKTGSSFYLRMDVHGATCFFKYLTAVKMPRNALMLSVEPGKKRLVAGDKIKFSAVFEKSARDVTVTLRNANLLEKIMINRNDYIQLVSEDKGKTWHGEMTVPEELSNKPRGSLIFEANILGGEFRKLYTSNPWTIQKK